VDIIHYFNAFCQRFERNFSKEKSVACFYARISVIFIRNPSQKGSWAVRRIFDTKAECYRSQASFSLKAIGLPSFGLRPKYRLIFVGFNYVQA
jgi:hypothetical protein